GITPIRTIRGPMGVTSISTGLSATRRGESSAATADTIWKGKAPEVPSPFRTVLREMGMSPLQSRIQSGPGRRVPRGRRHRSRGPATHRRSRSTALSLPRYRARELPARGLTWCEALAGQRGPDHLDRDRVLPEDGVMEGTVGHPAGLDQLAMERTELHAA